jgi:hypothetical protein
MSERPSFILPDSTKGLAVCCYASPAISCMHCSSPPGSMRMYLMYHSTLQCISVQGHCFVDSWAGCDVLPHSPIELPHSCMTCSPCISYPIGWSFYISHVLFSSPEKNLVPSASFPLLFTTVHTMRSGQVFWNTVVQNYRSSSCNVALTCIGAVQRGLQFNRARMPLGIVINLIFSSRASMVPYGACISDQLPVCSSNFCTTATQPFLCNCYSGCSLLLFSSSRVLMMSMLDTRHEHFPIFNLSFVRYGHFLIFQYHLDSTIHHQHLMLKLDSCDTVMRRSPIELSQPCLTRKPYSLALHGKQLLKDVNRTSQVF